MEKSSKSKRWITAATAKPLQAVLQEDFHVETVRLNCLTQSVGMARQACHGDGIPEAIAALSDTPESSDFVDEVEAELQQHSCHSAIAALNAALQQHWDRCNQCMVLQTYLPDIFHELD